MYIYIYIYIYFFFIYIYIYIYIYVYQIMGCMIQHKGVYDTTVIIQHFQFLKQYGSRLLTLAWQFLKFDMVTWDINEMTKS